MGEKFQEYLEEFVDNRDRVVRDEVVIEGEESFDEQFRKLGVQEKGEILSSKKNWSRYMMIALALQYFILVVFMVFQGFGTWGFYLDNWIFYIFISGTFVESCFLVRIIFVHLFSKKEQSNKKK